MPDKLIYIVEDKCKACYACIRVCPVKAIDLPAHSEIPKISDERCITCGSCYESCKPGAIEYLDSKERVKQLLSSEAEVVAIIDPTISGEFDDISDYRKFVSMLRSIGFRYVHETSFAVDLVARRYNDLISSFHGKYYLFANCPPMVSMIEKYFPELIDNLAPIVNPMVASAMIVRQIYGNTLKVVYVGPCVGAKAEARKYEGTKKVDEVLTFIELRQMFADAGIKESNIEFSEFDEPIGYKGGLFPITHGILQAGGLSQDLLTGSTASIDGNIPSVNSIANFNQSIDLIRKHLNVFYCEGCIMGPGTSPEGQKLKRRSLVVDYVNKRLKNFNMAKWNNDLKQFADLDFLATFNPDDQNFQEVAPEKIEEVLITLEKYNNSREIDCKACGYNTCREFASAVSREIVRIDLCTLYSLHNKQDYIKTLKVTNDILAKTQQALQQSEQMARKEQLSAQEALETTQTMLRKLPMAVVIVDDKMKVIGSNESFISILGNEAKEINEIIPGLIGADLKTLLPQQINKLFSYVLTSADEVIGRDVQFDDKLLNLTIFNIRKNKIVGGVIRDMYLPEVRREEVIVRVTEVIEQNLELVQQIAFLLGEGASNTERMLNSIIESYNPGKK